MKKRSSLMSRLFIAMGANPERPATIESVRKDLNLPANHNPSLEQLHEAGIEIPRPQAPAGPPFVPYNVSGQLCMAGGGLTWKPDAGARLQMCDSTGRCYDEDQIAAVMDVLNKNSQKDRYIELTAAEIQSNYDRVKWAEGLIRQLPETHDGRNSWLLNYGRKE